MLKRLNNNMSIIAGIGLLVFGISCCIPKSPPDLTQVNEVMENQLNNIWVSCSSEDLDLLEQVRKGDLEALKKLLDQHGPDFYCSGQGGQDLGVIVLDSENSELVEYYLAKKPSKLTMDMFFLNYLQPDSVYVQNPNKLKLFKLVLKSGARFPPNPFEIDTNLIKTAIKYGYDLTQFDEDGNNDICLLAMIYSNRMNEYFGVACDKIDFYQSQGLKIKHKNNEGKTAIDLVENRKLKAYLIKKARNE